MHITRIIKRTELVAILEHEIPSGVQSRLSSEVVTLASTEDVVFEAEEGEILRTDRVMDRVILERDEE